MFYAGHRWYMCHVAFCYFFRLSVHYQMRARWRLDGNHSSPLSHRNSGLQVVLERPSIFGAHPLLVAGILLHLLPLSFEFVCLLSKLQFRPVLQAFFAAECCDPLPHLGDPRRIYRRQSLTSLCVCLFVCVTPNLFNKLCSVR